MENLGSPHLCKDSPPSVLELQKEPATHDPNDLLSSQPPSQQNDEYDEEEEESDASHFFMQALESA